MKKKCNVVKLITKDITNISVPVLGLEYDPEGFDPHIVKTFHLYITSDDEIKEGDWFIANQGVHQCLEVVEGDYPYKIKNQYHKDKEIQFQSKQWNQRVIASTDKSLEKITKNIDGLGNDLHEPLPGIPESFIKKYVEENGEIDEILVEFDWVNRKRRQLKELRDYLPKTRKDNTIRILPAKTYTHEEVEKLCKRAYDFGFEGGVHENTEMYSKQHDSNSIREWLAKHVD